MTHYIVATDRPWTLAAFAESRSRLPGEWFVVTSPRDLEHIIDIRKPRYVFFPHWSHIVPREILDQVECVCFHMADVPYGRGGSPLQNLVVRGHRGTVLTALRMTEEVDAGPVYLKQPLSLAGTAQEVFQRMASQTLDLIEMIIQEEPTPTPQPMTDVVTFSRRKPAQSVLPEGGDIDGIYDHIRMLDAQGYPKALLDHGCFRLTFSDPHLGYDGVVRAQVEITENVDLATGEVVLRDAEISDSGRIFSWRYSGDAARFYESSEVPLYQDHVSWLTKNLAAPDRTLLIGTIQGLAVSHVRFDHSDAETELSTYVDARWRGKKIGTRTLRAAIERHCSDRSDMLVAWVHHDNEASLHLFTSCGFVEATRQGAFVRFELPTITSETQ
jgi:methionyl-tRNA formyltransferase